MTAIIDYGVGNLFSLMSSLSMIGEESVITSDVATLQKADRVILPGVGAFGDAAQKLRDSGMDRVVRELASSGKPLMGICLGMQLLFDESLEYGRHEGLGLIGGRVVPMEGYLPDNLKIPHIGWNGLHLTKTDVPMLRYVQEGDFVYFVHSFFADDCREDTAAVTEYGKSITAAVARGNVCGCQFHPEKSGKVGLAILKGFCEMREQA